MQKNRRPNLISVTTINPDGSHYVLHPADVKGKFTTTRRIVGILLIAVYVLLPWIPINDAPALFLDVENRRFHIFGLTLLAQDLWVFFFLLSGLGFESGGISASHAVGHGFHHIPEFFEVPQYHGELVAFGTLVQLLLERRKPAFLDTVFGFCVSVGLPITFAEMTLKDLTDEA